MANKKASYDIEKAAGTRRLRCAQTRVGARQRRPADPGKAIDRAKELKRDARFRVERIRNTKAGSPDKWRMD